MLDCIGDDSWDEQKGPDKMKEECGVFGIYGPGHDVARLTYFGLFALQHRGQESAGIAVSDGEKISLYKEMGLVSEVFNDRNLATLKGNIAIGHVRYSTTGGSFVANAQPMVFRYQHGMLGIAHNGNLTNTGELRTKMAAKGAIFSSTTDTEVLINLIARNCTNSLEEAIMKSMEDVDGSYALCVLTEDKLVAVRDPHGVRPLCLGKLNDAYVVASESCAFDLIGAEFVRDIEPGEILVIDKEGLTSLLPLEKKQRSMCIFEYIYFARPDSKIDGLNVNLARREMGRQLARESRVEADIVVPVPDSGTAAALGYAEEAGIPFEQGLLKNKYVGRTFIQPSQEMRALAVRKKLNPIVDAVKGKRIILIDDSIVRGTTSGKIVAMLRDAGAAEVHLMITSPPITHSCYYGIDTSIRKELIAARKTVDEICEYVGADSLHYISLEGLYGAMHLPPSEFCVACFNGQYPIPIEEEARNEGLE